MNNTVFDDTVANNDVGVRPKSLDDFIGQKGIISNLTVYLEAAQKRHETLDHTLFSGPPGLGKTTLARILAENQKGHFYQISAPNLKRPGDIAKILTGLEQNDTLFIDEIHRLPAPVEEILYPAMEDGKVDIAISEGLSATPIELDLPSFTLVGATTKPGSLTAPLRDRFGIHLRLDFYENNEIAAILYRASKLWEIPAGEKSLELIAERSRRTPRIALRLLRRIWDFALVKNKKEKVVIDQNIVETGFASMKIDSLGLTELDNEFLRVMADHHKGGPVGLKPLSVVLSEDIITLEDFIEPYMIKLDLIQRTPRGRILTDKGYAHLGKKPIFAEKDLFHDEL